MTKNFINSFEIEWAAARCERLIKLFRHGKSFGTSVLRACATEFHLVCVSSIWMRKVPKNSQRWRWLSKSDSSVARIWIGFWLKLCRLECIQQSTNEVKKNEYSHVIILSLFQWFHGDIAKKKEKTTIRNISDEPRQIEYKEWKWTFRVCYTDWTQKKFASKESKSVSLALDISKDLD